MGYALKVAIHVGLVFAAFIAAYELRRGLSLDWWLTHPDALKVGIWAVLYAGIAAVVELFFQTEKAAWRFSSAREALSLVRSTAITAGAFLVLIFLSNRGISLPRSTLVLSWLLSFSFLIGVRLIWRIFHNPGLVGISRNTSQALEGASPLVLVGDLADADGHIRRLRRENGESYAPVGIVTSDRKSVGLLVNSVPVLGHMDDLHPLAETATEAFDDAPSILFLSDPITHLGLSAEQIGHLKKAGFRLLRRPNLVEIGQHDGRGDTLREIALEEFLPRAPVSLDPTPVEGLIAGRRVLVTGAGGSIGSEIARQLVGFGCSHITLVDHSEFNLFQIDRELAQIETGATQRAALCNVRDADRLREIFCDEKPDIVFHAAALKHVTLVEENPYEGFLTNVVGTRNVIEGARACGAAQMILISTDKAVAPTSVMGATKRIAESLVSAQCEGPTRFCSVRFGNVLGSAGSVIPIFREQIEKGGPVTVTHPEVERYFMTIPEAVQLVLHATVLSAVGSETRPRQFVLEMGEPVKIADLARQLIRLYGYVPDVDIGITFTGLKPGEKLTEEVLGEEETGTPCVPGVLEINPSGQPDAIDGDTVVRVAEAMSYLSGREPIFEVLAMAGARRETSGGAQRNLRQLN